MKLIGYLRVSSDAQVDGYGLEGQEKAVTDWAARHEHQLNRLVVDAGVSASIHR